MTDQPSKPRRRYLSVDDVQAAIDQTIAAGPRDPEPTYVAPQPTKRGRPFPATPDYVEANNDAARAIGSALAGAAGRALAPRDLPCTHPARRRTSLTGDIVREQCRLCDVHLVTDRRTNVTTVEVTG